MEKIKDLFALICLCLLCVLCTACPGDSHDDIIDDYDDKWNSSDKNKDDDLTFWYVFDPTWPSIYENGTYTHQVWIGFGVSKGHYSAGITKFGIGLSTPDGTDITTNGKKGNDKEVSVTTTKIKGKSMKFYSANIYDDSEYDWDGFFFVKSKNKTIKIEYVCRYYNSINNEWVETDLKTQNYTPKSVSNN